MWFFTILEGLSHIFIDQKTQTQRVTNLLKMVEEVDDSEDSNPDLSHPYACALNHSGKASGD